METTTKTRRKDLVQFVKHFDLEYNKEINGNYIYNKTTDMFSSTRIAAGIEGTVYESSFKHPSHFSKLVAIKEINLLKVQESKQIPKKILKMTTDNLYKLFYTAEDFNKPCFTELITQTIVNQLILQKICPNFSFNYYWEHDNTVIKTYNEFVNAGDFHQWARENHSYHEWCNALFQIMVGLLSLKRYFNMLHTDFHTRNILVYKVKKGGYWTYTINGFKYYLPNLGYQFLIHDFGFAWIPEKMTIDWHYSDTLKHVTNAGEHYYDISSLLRELFANKHFRLPKKFKEFVNSSFLPEELNYTLAKSYYKLYAKPADLSKYPDIKKSYNGAGTTLLDKIYQIFHNKDGYDLSRRIRGQRIESYSLDKTLDKSKLPRTFRRFVTQ